MGNPSLLDGRPPSVRLGSRGRSSAHWSPRGFRYVDAAVETFGGGGGKGAHGSRTSCLHDIGGRTLSPKNRAYL